MLQEGRWTGSSHTGELRCCTMSGPVYEGSLGEKEHLRKGAQGRAGSSVSSWQQLRGMESGPPSRRLLFCNPNVRWQELDRDFGCRIVEKWATALVNFALERKTFVLSVIQIYFLSVVCAYVCINTHMCTGIWAYQSPCRGQGHCVSSSTAFQLMFLKWSITVKLVFTFLGNWLVSSGDGPVSASPVLGLLACAAFLAFA